MLTIKFDWKKTLEYLDVCSLNPTSCSRKLLSKDKFFLGNDSKKPKHILLEKKNKVRNEYKHKHSARPNIQDKRNILSQSYNK